MDQWEWDLICFLLARGFAIQINGFMAYPVGYWNNGQWVMTKEAYQWWFTREEF